MTDLSSKTVAVCDSGLFVHIAQCLAGQFGKVYYHSPSQHVFGHIADAVIGDGFDNIERIEEPYPLIGNVDCWCFPDTGQGEFQRYLTGLGEPVWGHHGADALEIGKGLFLRTLKESGLPIPAHTAIKGLANLRAFLNDKQDVFIKVSKYRGDFETAHFRNLTLDARVLDGIAQRFGPLQDLITFYVFDRIDTDIEDGIDTWRIEGEWPKRILHAMERKDKSLIGALQDFADVAEPVREVNERFASALDRYGYRGAFSTEVRLAEDVPYFIDPTCRFGSPPSQLQSVMIDNLPQVIYHGARGEMVEPEAEHSVGAQVLITSDREKEEWLPFQMAKELRPWIRASFSCQIEDVLTIAPNPIENFSGWLLATGDSIAEVIETLKERKAMLPDGFDCDLRSLCDLLEELHKAEKQDVTIAEPIPQPSAAL